MQVLQSILYIFIVHLHILKENDLEWVMEALQQFDRWRKDYYFAEDLISKWVCPKFGKLAVAHLAWNLSALARRYFYNLSNYIFEIKD